MDKKFKDRDLAIDRVRSLYIGALESGAESVVAASWDIRELLDEISWLRYSAGIEQVPVHKVVEDDYEYAVQFYDTRNGHVADISEKSWLTKDDAQEEVDSHVFLPESPIRVRLVRRLKSEQGIPGKVEIVG